MEVFGFETKTLQMSVFDTNKPFKDVSIKAFPHYTYYYTLQIAMIILKTNDEIAQ